MEVLTVQEAADSTGWSPRMLRYVESIGLVVADRSPAGYRLYGPGHLQRLRTLRELVQNHGIGLDDMGFARRLQAEPGLRAAVEEWLVSRPARPAGVEPGDWLRWEQDKHQRLLESAPPLPDEFDPSHSDASDNDATTIKEIA